MTGCCIDENILCSDDDEVDFVLREIPKGICGNHSGARSLAFKAILANDALRCRREDQAMTTHTIMTVDYFTKWVEIELLRKITKIKTTDFI